MTDPKPLSAEEEDGIRQRAEAGYVTAAWLTNATLLRLLATLDAARAATPAAPKSYWQEFLAWESEAAAQGSGMTDEQKTGAALFRSWIVNHAPDDGRPEAAAPAAPEALREAAQALAAATPEDEDRDHDHHYTRGGSTSGSTTDPRIGPTPVVDASGEMGLRDASPAAAPAAPEAGA